MKLLHINSSPRSAKSNTLRLAQSFMEQLKTRYQDLEIEELDLFEEDLPAVAGTNIEVKYKILQRQSIDRGHQESWQRIEALIQNFLSADIYLISAPMWNLTIPYALKYYIDAIVQPGYLFRYNELGYPDGMVINKKMICVTSRGGDYSQGSPAHAYDFQESYLRAIFGFVGITDIQFVNAQPMDINPEIREMAINKAMGQLETLAQNYGWA